MTAQISHPLVAVDAPAARGARPQHRPDGRAGAAPGPDALPAPHARWWSHSTRVQPWQVEVRHRVDDLEVQARGVPAPRRSDIDAQLAAARRATLPPFPRRQWWNGTSIETAWSCVHLAQSQLPLVVADTALARYVVDARRRAVLRLAKGDPVRLALEDTDLAGRVQEGAATDEDRVTVGAALQAALEIGDDEHRRLRDWRNRLLRVAALATVALALTLVVAGTHPGFLPLCVAEAGAAPVCPGGGAPGADDARVVAFLGALGGALAAIVAMRRASPGASPYRITPALSLLRVPLGGLTAVVGVLLVQSGEVPGLALTRVSQVAVFALLFGFCQELVTRLLESRARVVQDATRGRTSKADAHDVATDES
ncbi:hypothetical protein [Cellulomonas sp. HZM]|uniref:hypothetical protein n=1 Tax=Cellulomonas sp. HZM TaxID=1454010 RepID=UPI000492FF6F|nr:hypothetical protein [Cellulomonas sp. HZM]